MQPSTSRWLHRAHKLEAAVNNLGKEAADDVDQLNATIIGRMSLLAPFLKSKTPTTS